eukprot:6469941-Amphidinium_carterae.4
MPPPRLTCSMKAGSCCRSLVMRVMHWVSASMASDGCCCGCAGCVTTGGASFKASDRWSCTVVAVSCCTGFWDRARWAHEPMLAQGWLSRLSARGHAAPAAASFAAGLLCVLGRALAECLESVPGMTRPVGAHLRTRVCAAAPGGCRQGAAGSMSVAQASEMLRDCVFFRSLAAGPKDIELACRNGYCSFQDITGCINESERSNVSNVDGDLVERELRWRYPCLGVLSNRTQVEHRELARNEL